MALSNFCLRAIVKPRDNIRHANKVHCNILPSFQKGYLRALLHMYKIRYLIWPPAMENVFRVCVAWYKHERGWANLRQICKPSTSSLVCITVKNSPNPSKNVLQRFSKFQPTRECINEVHLSSFQLKKPFQIRGCVISTRKAKHLDVTTMLTYSHHGSMLSCKHASRPIRERVLS